LVPIGGPDEVGFLSEEGLPADQKAKMGEEGAMVYDEDKARVHI
jgi:hypothetical protein